MSWAPPEEATKISVEAPDLTGTNWKLAFPAIALFAGLFLLGGWSAMVIAGLLISMIFMHELGHYMAARKAGMKVTEFFLGFGPRIWSFRRGDTEFGVKAIWLGAYVKVPGMSNLEPIPASEEHTTYRSKSYRWRVLMASAGSLMHFAMALVMLFALFVGYGVPSQKAWSIEQIQPGSAAAKAGMQVGDRIVGVNGLRYDDYRDVRQQIMASPNSPVSLVIVREGVELTLNATPTSATDEVTGDTVGRLGFVQRPGFESVGVGEAAGKTVVSFGRVFKENILGIGKIFSPSGLGKIGQALANQGKDSDGKVIEERPSSIVGIGSIGSDAVRNGFASTLEFMVIINIGIGIFNLIPLLPLDGGHIVIATYERIRSRKGRRHYADLNKAVPLFYATLFALGLLFLSSLYLDIVT
jgi:membrane-associated protease RseP (regulator of RpoE activity)